MKMNLIGARQKKINLHAKGQALLAAAKAENRELTTGEASQFERIMADLNVAQAELIEIEAALERERAQPLDGSFQISGDGMGTWHEYRRPAAGHPAAAGTRRGFSELFPGAQSDGGFSSFSEYLRAVNFSHQVFDPRLMASMTESVPSQSGFLVPEQWSAAILQQALEDAIVLPRAQIWPMTSDVLKIPGVRDVDHSSSTLFGGVSAHWSDELDTLADANVKTRLIQLTARKLGMLSVASSELAEDSNFESVLTSSLQSAAQWHLDNAFLYGDGAGKPQGMLSSANPALVTVTHDTATPANSVIYEDALALYGAMAPRCRQRALFIINDAHLPAVMKFQNIVKSVDGLSNVGGSAVPTFTMNADGTGTLLGRPALFTEKAAAAGDLGDFAFCDISSYAVGLRREIRLERSIHANFTSDGVTWRLTVRVDGQSTWDAPLKQKNAQLVSPFCVLSAR